MASFRGAILLNRASPQVADRLCALGEPVSLSKGEELPSDAEDDRLVFVSSGSAKLTAQAEPEQTHILAFHFPGDFVSVLRRCDGYFRLIALTDVELVVFQASSFLDLAQEEPAVLRSVLARSIQALHRSRTKMMRLGHKSARQRIADFLVSMAERICGCTCGSCEISLPMSRRDIGDSLGLKIETVSRQFTDLRDEGLIETTGRSLVKFNDLKALAAEAGHALSSEIQPQN